MDADSDGATSGVVSSPGLLDDERRTTDACQALLVRGMTLGIIVGGRRGVPVNETLAVLMAYMVRMAGQMMKDGGD